ncbi:hypothetical protein MSAN_00847300 [Mycena sanguinolenta]|uniref:DUF6533 domain-containing protein n=1 Tax=Mycena sanguinolenta TaxID=230812 RepID=A0A8H6YYX5_9AGAR|nr:hypothetical protein MSAN_00847300 [Mycena sanguinolenta]
MEAPSPSGSDALAAMYLQTVKYFDVVAAAILIFDYCLTFSLEVSLMWPSRWSLPKVLYVLSRYSPFFDIVLVLYYASPAVSLAHCAQLNTGTAGEFLANIISVSGFLTCFAVGNVFGIAVAEAIFVLRTYALSGRQPKILLIFGTIYSVNISIPVRPSSQDQTLIVGSQTCLVATIVMIGIFLRNMIYSPPPLGIPVCNLTGGPFILVGLSFILVLLNETALMSYTLRIMVKTYRYNHSPLVETLFRDGITYYVFLCLGSAANIVILVSAPSELRDVLNTPLRVLHSVLSTRTLLHVREAERRMEMSWTAVTRGNRASTVHFAD